jgi:exodeoxyribonuclease V
VITLEECTAQQLTALDEIEAWWADWHDNGYRQVYRQNGLAGTGKTSLARLAAQRLGVADETFYAAFTGKAAHVLRTKGCVGAQTIHSLIYSPAEHSRGRLLELHRRLEQAADAGEYDEIAESIAAEQAKLRQAAFVLRDDSELRDASLLVLDEASMVSPRIGQDLESFGVPILVLGDPMQLPPIDGAGYFMGRADNTLTEVQRSAADSPVTRMATAIRNAAPNDPRFGVYGADGHSGRFTTIAAKDLVTFDQVIVGTNRTRWSVIRTIRAAHGWFDNVPHEGDRVIVLANNPDIGVFNGQQFTVAHASPVRDGGHVLTVVDDMGARRVLSVWAGGFTPGGDTKELCHSGRRGTIAAATFAQAVTCHKAQGSQYGCVLVIDEARVFRDMAQRWLYTAVTRAERQAVIVGGIRR